MIVLFLKSDQFHLPGVNFGHTNFWSHTKSQGVVNLKVLVGSSVSLIVCVAIHTVTV